jgi:hypothetical protein
MLSLKFTKPKVTDRFQDGRRRHVRNATACFKMGNYHMILMKIGTQTEDRHVEFKIYKSGGVGQLS